MSSKRVWGTVLHHYNVFWHSSATEDNLTKIHKFIGRVKNFTNRQRFCVFQQNFFSVATEAINFAASVDTCEVWVKDFHCF